MLKVSLLNVQKATNLQFKKQFKQNDPICLKTSKTSKNTPLYWINIVDNNKFMIHGSNIQTQHFYFAIK